jgi:hypothetical protein
VTKLKLPFRSASDKVASVEDHLTFSRDTYHWDVSFIRPVHDWELESGHHLWT